MNNTPRSGAGNPSADLVVSYSRTSSSPRVENGRGTEIYPQSPGDHFKKTLFFTPGHVDGVSILKDYASIK
jgi:hypothetical protein